MWFHPSKPPVGETYLRAASPNERRCIARESLAFYGCLVVGGIYQFSKPVEVRSISTYTHALRQCVDLHPPMSSAAADAESNSPYYQFCTRLDLDQHIQLLEHRDGNELKAIESVLPHILDARWPLGIPAWRIVVLPFSDKECFIAFCYSHALGDGMSGIAFHRTFLHHLQEECHDKELIYMPKFKQLHPAFDTSDNLPISWAFLLSPLLGAYAPTWIASLFGLRAAADSIVPGTWTGSSMFLEPQTHRTAVEILSIDTLTLNETLRICRTYGAKLTALLHQLIINALSTSLPRPNDVANLAARTSLNMRGPVGRSNDEMGNIISGDFQVYPIETWIKSRTDREIDWAQAKSVTDKLAVAANELCDQPIGLLRYLTNVRSWVLSQVGQSRDCSYELSNLASFRPSGPIQRCSVSEMVFCQPADVTGAPLTFNVVSVTDGPLSIAVSWQIGALDLPPGKDETEFVHAVCQEMRRGFDKAASTSET